MKEVNQVRESMDDSLADVGPESFRERIAAVLEGTSLTPGALTIKTARAIEPAISMELVARRGAGVQLSYEGLRLTRSILDGEPWQDAPDSESYYLDLLAADVLVSHGFNHLADTGTATQAVEIVQRFGRNQTHEQAAQPEKTESTLEIDAIELAVNTGADCAMQTVPPSITAYATDLAREIQDRPLPDSEAALRDVDERIATLTSSPQVSEVDE